MAKQFYPITKENLLKALKKAYKATDVYGVPIGNHKIGLHCCNEQVYSNKGYEHYISIEIGYNTNMFFKVVTDKDTCDFDTCIRAALKDFKGKKAICVFNKTLGNYPNYTQFIDTIVMPMPSDGFIALNKFIKKNGCEELQLNITNSERKVGSLFCEDYYAASSLLERIEKNKPRGAKLRITKMWEKYDSRTRGYEWVTSIYWRDEETTRYNYRFEWVKKDGTTAYTTMLQNTPWYNNNNAEMV